MVLSLKTVVAFALATVLLVTPRVARAADPPLDLERLTVSDLQQRIAAGELTSVQLTRAYINRIAAVNARGPGINAVRSSTRPRCRTRRCSTSSARPAT